MFMISRSSAFALDAESVVSEPGLSLTLLPLPSSLTSPSIVMGELCGCSRRAFTGAVALACAIRSAYAILFSLYNNSEYFEYSC